MADFDLITFPACFVPEADNGVQQVAASERPKGVSSTSTQPDPKKLPQ
jgi:hypothetical protein